MAFPKIDFQTIHLQVVIFHTSLVTMPVHWITRLLLPLSLLLKLIVALLEIVANWFPV
jgi:hypothetical protein